MSTKRQAVTRLTLDMSLDAVQKSVAISKGDTNRRMEITLTDAGRPFALPSTWTATLSGGQLEDGCVVDRGRIVYDMAGGVLTAEAGIFELAFRIFDEEGDEVATPTITCNVYDIERNTEAVASTDEFSVLQEFIKNINDVDTRLDNLDKRIIVSTKTIDPTVWTDDTPFEAKILVDTGVVSNNEENKAVSILLIPMDNETRLAAQNTELAVDSSNFVLAGILSVRFTRRNDAPTTAMNFACVAIVVDNDTNERFPVTASFVGVTELPDELMEREVMRVVEPYLDAGEAWQQEADGRLDSLDVWLGDLESSTEEMQESIENLNKRIMVSMMTIAPTEWTDDTPLSTIQYIYSGNIQNDTLTKAASILLIPMDKYTREEAQNTELTVDSASFPVGLLQLVLTRTNDAPTIALQFACVTILVDNPTDGGFPVSASFVGVTKLSDDFMYREVKRVLDANKYASEERVTELINEALGVIENGSY